MRIFLDRARRANYSGHTGDRSEVRWSERREHRHREKSVFAGVAALYVYIILILNLAIATTNTYRQTTRRSCP